MHSRAFMLLRRDLVNLQRFPLTGITALPASSDSLFHWSAKIEGLGGTMWEGGVFQISLSFTEEFNTRPPDIHFMTIPFHPNVDPQGGVPSCHLLSEGWSEECSASSILLALQVLLGNPELEGGCVLNKDAARLLKEAPHTYRQMALDCVTASLRIDAGLSPYESEEERSPNKEIPVGRSPSLKHGHIPKRPHPLKPVSFDDYHTLWKGIATSHPTTKHKPSQFLQLLQRDSHLQTVHCASTVQEQQANLERRLEEHALLKYGNFKDSKTVPKLDLTTRVQRIEELKQMYREATKAGKAQGEQTTRGENGDEIENLVQWTRNLDEQELST